MATKKEERITVSSEATFTDPIYSSDSFSVAVYGLTANGGTVSVQCLTLDADGEDAWLDVDTIIEDGVYEVPSHARPYRVGVKEGSFGNGAFTLHAKGR